jgi:hypothetical protein
MNTNNQSKPNKSNPGDHQKRDAAPATPEKSEDSVKQPTKPNKGKGAEGDGEEE